MNQTEAARLTAIVWNVRPDWNQTSIHSFIVKNLLDKPYQLAVVAFVACAVDPETKTPARVLEAGPWWKAAQAALGYAATTPTPAKLGTCKRCGNYVTETDHQAHCRPRTTDQHAARERAFAQEESTP